MTAHIVLEVVWIPPWLVDEVHVDNGLDVAVLWVLLWIASCVGAQRAALWPHCMPRRAKDLHGQFLCVSLSSLISALLCFAAVAPLLQLMC